MKLSNNKQGIILDKSIQKPSAMFLSTTGQGEISYYNGDFHFTYSDGTLINVKDLTETGATPAGSDGDVQINYNSDLGITSSIFTDYVLGVYDGTGDEPAGFNFADYTTTGNYITFGVGGTDSNSFDVNVANSATSGKLNIIPDNNRFYHTVTDTTGTTGIYGINGALTLQAVNGYISLDSDTTTISNVPLVLTAITEPTTPSGGMMYYNSTDTTFYGYNGSDWMDLLINPSGNNGDLQLNNGGVLGTASDITSGITAIIDDGTGVTGTECFYVGDSTFDKPYMLLGTNSVTNGFEVSVGNESSGNYSFLGLSPGTSANLTTTNSSGTVGITANNSTGSLSLHSYYRVLLESPLVFSGESSDPDTIGGLMYYNTTDNSLHFYNGTAWYTIDMTAV